MKATLTFDLDAEDGKNDLLTALHGVNYSLTLWAVDQHCRNVCKYQEISKATRSELERIRDLIREETEGTWWEVL